MNVASNSNSVVSARGLRKAYKDKVALDGTMSVIDPISGAHNFIVDHNGNTTIAGTVTVAKQATFNGAFGGRLLACPSCAAVM